ncbi:DUF1501 domain-containing protein [Sphingomonas adhaesiva]|uniref:DUF1501 domain-containing protein n=1 Tax=Sphingomonas adhaesiva TaxID=28212 RepID=UPI002FF9FC26
MPIHHDESRRAFLRRAALLGLAGTAAPFAGTLGAIGEAAAATGSGYKALVCVYLAGGCDYANTLVPYDPSSYDAYAKVRGSIALGRDTLLALDPAGLSGGRQYAMAPALAPLAELYAQGKVAPILNVGTLVQPTTKAQYNNRSVLLPPKLFSHNDQSSYFQASNPEGAPSGWGGRIGDLVQSGNGAASLTCINASGNAVYLTGRQAVQYSVGTGGPIALLSSSKTIYGSATAAQTLRDLITRGHPNMLANEHARVSKRALDTFAQVNGALANAPAANFTLFPTSNSLADQLKMVARMIAVAGDLGVRRQVFFVSMGGFDVHDNILTTQPMLLGKVAAAMRAFHDTTVQLGVSEQVTTFTASEFGRTLTSNGDGSDHGWGSMHFAMGGAVKGGRSYGIAPTVGINTNDDVGQGRLIPTTSVDQYAASLASWFGVSASDMRTVLPNIGNYDASSWNLGFV